MKYIHISIQFLVVFLLLLFFFFLFFHLRLFIAFGCVVVLSQIILVWFCSNVCVYSISYDKTVMMCLDMRDVLTLNTVSLAENAKVQISFQKPQQKSRQVCENERKNRFSQTWILHKSLRWNDRKEWKKRTGSISRYHVIRYLFAMQFNKFDFFLFFRSHTSRYAQWYVSLHLI